MIGNELPVVGDQRTSQGRTVTESDIRAWAGLVHDFTSLHVDAELMRTSLFGRPIAHGYIALNFAIGLMFPEHASWYAPDGVDDTIGWTDVQFLAPVYAGDTLQCRRTVTSAEPGVVAHQVEMINQDGTVVVSGAEIMRRRP